VAGVDEDTTISKSEVWVVEAFLAELGLRNPRRRKPFIEEEGLTKPFLETDPPAGFKSGSTAAASLAEKSLTFPWGWYQSSTDPTPLLTSLGDGPSDLREPPETLKTASPLP
jgi:hypothetical protein